MRYTITSDQLHHFHTQGMLELEGLYTPEELETLPLLLEADFQTNPTGRDLERQDLPLFKALKLKRLGQVATTLFRQKRIKLGLTQYHPNFPDETIDQNVCVSEILGSALIFFSEEKRGKVFFYAVSTPIRFSQVPQPALLLVLTKESAQYRLQEKDPHLFLLKKLGYGYGDHLTVETHPLIHI